MSKYLIRALNQTIISKTIHSSYLRLSPVISSYIKIEFLQLFPVFSKIFSPVISSCLQLFPVVTGNNWKLDNWTYTSHRFRIHIKKKKTI